MMKLFKFVDKYLSLFTTIARDNAEMAFFLGWHYFYQKDLANAYTWFIRAYSKHSSKIKLHLYGKSETPADPYFLLGHQSYFLKENADKELISYATYAHESIPLPQRMSYISIARKSQSSLEIYRQLEGRIDRLMICHQMEKEETYYLQLFNQTEGNLVALLSDLCAESANPYRDLDKSKFYSDEAKQMNNFFDLLNFIDQHHAAFEKLAQVFSSFQILLGYYYFYRQRPKEAHQAFLKAYLNHNEKGQIQFYQDTEGLICEHTKQRTFYDDIKSKYDSEINQIFYYQELEDNQGYKKLQHIRDHQRDKKEVIQAETYLCTIEGYFNHIKINYYNGSSFHELTIQESFVSCIGYYATLSYEGHQGGTLALGQLSFKENNPYSLKHALGCFKHLAEQGHMKGIIYLARTFMKIDQEKHADKIVNLLTRAIQAGDAQGSYWLGIYYLYNDIKELEIAFNYLEEAARQEDAEAILMLGHFYHIGLFVKRDENQAFLHYQLAAKKELADGQALLGYCYETGIWIVRDPKKAQEAYRLAKEQGSQLKKEQIKEVFENLRIKKMALFNKWN